MLEAPWGQSIDCECGATHVIAPDAIHYSDDALSQASAFLGAHVAGRRVCLLMDGRTREVAGDALADAMAPHAGRLQIVEIPDREGGPGGHGEEARWPVCDDQTMGAISAALEAPEFLLAVGSGVINDLAKWVAFEQGIDFACFATAASMNGYASANVAPTLQGVKSLIQARPPVAVLASGPILTGAPSAMTTAGLGDVLAKSVSSADWRLNHLLFGDFYCPRAVGMIDDIEPLYLDRPEAIRSRCPQAIGGLFQALLLTGAAMTMAGSSAPASGGEHMISHALDMMSSLDGRAHDLHGRQVGVGTILMAALYQRLLTLESPDFAPPTAPDIPAAVWGPLRQGVAQQVAAKAPRMDQARSMLARRDNWDRIREEIAPMIRPPEKARLCLEQAGGAFLAEHIRCDRDRLRVALLHAHTIRSRFTVLDLARLVGVMPREADALLDAWG